MRFLLCFTLSTDREQIHLSQDCFSACLGTLGHIHFSVVSQNKRVSEPAELPPCCTAARKEPGGEAPDLEAAARSLQRLCPSFPG